MAGFWNRTQQTVAAAAQKARGFFTGGNTNREPRATGVDMAAARLAEALQLAPIAKLPGGMDDSSGCNTIKQAYGMSQPNISDALLMWFLNQGFIGHQIAAFIAQHWLVDKACVMPARDAVRQGYSIVSDDGGELDAKVLRMMQKADERFRVMDHLVEFVHKGRVFGIRIALFKVESTDQSYYENPFNADGVMPGQYKGIVQIDPYWIAPILDMASASDPASLHFYEPTWWVINGKKYHRSHLIIFRNGDVADVLKPVYLYGGKPLPQLILERVYCAERTANEAPQLAMTKRSTILSTDLEAALADQGAFDNRLAQWVNYRDNYGIKIIGKDADEIEQFDTTLTDLDAVIMSQYQIVAAIAGVPATKLLGTSPKGFNATGEFEESNYHEELESIQTHDLTPFLERHHLLVMRSIIMPTLKLSEPVGTSVQWESLDSPTAKEVAETQKTEAERDKALVDAGAIDGEDVRNRIRTNKASGYYGITPVAPEPPEPPVTVAAPGLVGDSYDGVRLVSNQKFLDPGIVSQKIAAGDFEVQVSPLFVDEHGNRYRIVIDGHHSLAAAGQTGVAPVLVENDYAGSDYTVIAE